MNDGCRCASRGKFCSGHSRNPIQNGKSQTELSGSQSRTKTHEANVNAGLICADWPWVSPELVEAFRKIWNPELQPSVLCNKLQGLHAEKNLYLSHISDFNPHLARVADGHRFTMEQCEFGDAKL